MAAVIQSFLILKLSLIGMQASHLSDVAKCLKICIYDKVFKYA